MKFNIMCSNGKSGVGCATSLTGVDLYMLCSKQITHELQNLSVNTEK